MKENLSLPFQVESLINNMMDEKQSVYIRSNYRNTLDNISRAVDKAVRHFDKQVHELANAESKKKRK